MRAENAPNYGIRAVLLVLAVGILGVIVALASNSTEGFLTFNLNHMLALGVILLIGGVLLLFGAFQNVAAGMVANAIIALGVIAVIVSIVLGLGRLASDFLSFDLTQILVLGGLFILVGFLLRNWLDNSQIIVPRRIAWTLIVLGVVFAIGALVAGAGTLLGFIPAQMLAMGAVFAVVGFILLLMYRGNLDAPTPAAMAQARVATMKAASSSAPTAPRAAPMVSTQVAPPTPAAAPAMTRTAVPSMDKKDDLTIIEGIGPKSADALYKAKIYTFRQVAELSPEDLHRIVKIEGGVNLVNDTKSWPKQAKLLSEGKRQEFEDYVKLLINSRDPGSKK